MLLKVPQKQTAASAGSVLLMTLVLLLFFSTQLLNFALLTSRGVTQEAVLLTQNSAAREATTVAFNELENALMTYLRDNTYDTTDVMTEFGQGQASSIQDFVVQTTNPETDGVENTSMLADAWLDSRRGEFYKFKANVRYGEVDITAEKWLHIPAHCPESSGGTLTTLSTTFYMHSGMEDDAIMNPSTGGFIYNTGRWNQRWYDPDTQTSSSLGCTPPLAMNAETGSIFCGGNHKYYGTPGALSQITLLQPLSRNGTIPASFETVSIDVENDILYASSQEDSIGRGLIRWDPADPLTATRLDNMWISDGRQYTVQVNQSSGRVYYRGSQWDEGQGVSNVSSPRALNTWAPSTGWTTILPNGKMPGNHSLVLDANDERIYFGEARCEDLTNCPDLDDQQAHFYSWSPSTGLSTILAASWGSRSSRNSGRLNTYLDPTRDRIFFSLAPGNTNERLYMWSSATGLRTIMDMGSTPSDSHPAGEFGVLDHATGHMYLPININDGVMLYKPETDTLTTIFVGSTDIDALVASGHHVETTMRSHGRKGSMHGMKLWRARPTGTLYPGAYFRNSHGVYYYNDTTGLTTIFYDEWSLPSDGGSMIMDDESGQLFFTAFPDSGGAAYLYDPATGELETLASGLDGSPHWRNSLTNAASFTKKRFAWAFYHGSGSEGNLYYYDGSGGDCAQ
jgi:hypothetical protein